MTDSPSEISPYGHLVQSLKNQLTSSGAELDKHVHFVMPGSVAQRQLADVVLGAAVEDAIALTLMSMLDHAFAMAVLLTEPAHSHASLTCFRAVLEIGAISLWLGDRKISASQRAERGLVRRWDDQGQQRRLAQGSPKVGSMLADIAVRQGTIRTQAAALGLRVATGKNGEVSGFGSERVPKISELVASVFGESDMWKVASGVAHGYTWASLNTSLATVPGDPPGVTPELHAGVGIYMLRATAKVVARVTYERFRLHGWPLVKLVEVHELAYSQIGISDDLRFWRTERLT